MRELVRLFLLDVGYEPRLRRRSGVFGRGEAAAAVPILARSEPPWHAGGTNGAGGKQMPECRCVPVAMVTSTRCPEDLLRCCHSRVDDFLPQPLSRELAAKVAALFSGPGADWEPALWPWRTSTGLPGRPFPVPSPHRWRESLADSEPGGPVDRARPGDLRPVPGGQRHAHPARGGLVVTHSETPRCASGSPQEASRVRHRVVVVLVPVAGALGAVAKDAVDAWKERLRRARRAAARQHRPRHAAVRVRGGGAREGQPAAPALWRWASSRPSWRTRTKGLVGRGALSAIGSGLASIGSQIGTGKWALGLSGAFSVATAKHDEEGGFVASDLGSTIALSAVAGADMRIDPSANTPAYKQAEACRSTAFNAAVLGVPAANGSEHGTFVSPEGVSSNARALHPPAASTPYNVDEVSQAAGGRFGAGCSMVW